jgi:arylsulfatase A-like enzyme
MACEMDLLPTFAALVGGHVPTDRTIDGRDIRKLMMNDPDGKGHDVYYFFWGRELQAVRSGQWKLHFAHKYIHVVVPGKDGQPGKTKELPLPESLFDMQSDPRELVNVIDQHPDIVEKLSKLAEVAREDLGDSLTKTAGKGVRPPGTVQKPGEQKASLDEKFWQREISVFNPND